MPYKSEKIKIAHTKYDKRIKITDDDKEEIIKKRKQGQSIRSLAREYKVDRNVIKIITDPNFDKRFKEADKIRQAKYLKEKRYADRHSDYMKTHRKYKQQLYLDKKIDFKNEKEGK